MDISVLKKIGFNDKEIRAYLGLLEYGATSVRSLAQKTGLNRGTTYDVLKKLQSSGLVSYYHHATRQKFIAEDPEKLTLLLDEKKKDLDRAQTRISDIVPELRSIQDKGGHTPTTKFYEGRAGIKAILNDVLSTMNDIEPDNREYYIYSATKASDDINGAYPNFTKKRISSKIRVKAISLARGGGMYGLDERRWLGTNRTSATFIMIYNGKCAYISRDANDSPVGVIIENKAVYETQRVIFLELWRLLS